MPIFKNAYRETSLWKRIVSAWDHVQAGIVWGLGNGNDAKFWVGKLIPGCLPLISYANNRLPEWQQQFTTDFYATEGVWNIQVLQHILPEDILAKLVTIPAPRANLHGDTPSYWAASTNGQFSRKSVYDIINHSQSAENDSPLCRVIWRWPEGCLKIHYVLDAMKHLKQ
ncbi:ribonuclease H [Sesbania bispinosa]|nr:ribonuclease H [Sesbania bispinosa]